jgi:hypothetical protein
VVLTGASVATRKRNGHHDDTPPWEREEHDAHAAHGHDDKHE